MFSPLQVYESMCGLLDCQSELSSIENEFAAGKKCAVLSDEIYEARQSLCQRFNIPTEDRDLERIINCFLEIERELCIKMYHYGQVNAAPQGAISQPHRCKL